MKPNNPTINVYPLTDNTILIARHELQPIRVKFLKRYGNFCVFRTTVKKTRYTLKDEAEGRLNERRAFTLTHIPSGRCIARFNSIKAAISCAEAASEITNKIGVSWEFFDEWTANERCAVYSRLRNYLSCSRSDVVYNDVVAGKEFPTAVQEEKSE